MPKEPNFNITAGISIIRAYIPFPAGPKTLAKIIETIRPKPKIRIRVEKVIALFFDILLICYLASPQKLAHQQKKDYVYKDIF